MRFIQADYLFDGQRFLAPGSTLVLDNAIIVDIIPETNYENVQRLTGLLMPGMVNAHCHLELSHMRSSLPEGKGLVDFLLHVNHQRNAFSEENIIEAIAKAEEEMQSNGIVAVGDICNTSVTLLQKQKRKLYYHNFVECFGLLDSNAEERFHAARQLYDVFASTLTASIVLHAPYSISDRLISLVDSVSSQQIGTIHNQESEEENKLFLNGQSDFLRLFEAMLKDSSFFKPSGKSSLQTYLPKLVSHQHLILVHNTFTYNEDIVWAQGLGQKLFWCLCPNANRFIEQALPNVAAMIASECEIVLGTDSLASNHQLSILAEISTLQNQYPEIELETILKWATLNGAKALGIEHKAGCFEKGKSPGVINISNYDGSNRIPQQPIIRVVETAHID